MLSTEIMDRYSKFLALMQDLLKVLAMAALALLAIGAWAAPDLVADRLEKLGITEFSLGGVKIQLAKAGANTLRMADALTKVEVELKKIEATAPTGATTVTKSVDGALETIHLALKALDEQSSAIQKTGTAAGLAPDVPTTGWLYVGLMDKNNAVDKLTDRIGSPDGLKFEGKDLKGIVLRFDAGVIPDGDDCTKTKATDFVPPDPRQPERQFTVLRASTEPLKVLKIAQCKSIADKKPTYAEVEVPKDRVRFATLSSLPKGGSATK